MTLYQNSTQFYSIMQALFNRVAETNPNAAEQIKKSKLILRFSCHDPQATILINGRRDGQVVTFGDDRTRPEVDVILRTDSLHHILLGDLGLAKSLVSKEIKVRGPSRKALALTDLFHECQSIYPEILQDHGLIQ